MDKPVTPEVGLLLLENIAVPLVTDQVPVNGEVAARVVEVVEHKVWFAPAEQFSAVVKLPASK